MLFCPGRGPLGHREFSLFAEVIEKITFPEKTKFFFT
jgi:hypothetical protein